MGFLDLQQHAKFQDVAQTMKYNQTSKLCNVTGSSWGSVPGAAVCAMHDSLAHETWAVATAIHINVQGKFYLANRTGLEAGTLIR